MQKRVDMAERNVGRAEYEVDRLRDAPIKPEPSVWEEIERVRRLVPNSPPPKRGKIHSLKSIKLVQRPLTEL